MTRGATVAASPIGADSDRHLLVPQLEGAGATSVWIGVVDAPVEGLRLVIGPTERPIPAAWETFEAAGRRLRAQRVPLTDLPPRTTIPIRLMDGATAVADATITTLPTALPSPAERPFTILFGSCFCAAEDPAGDAGSTLGRLPPDARPDLTVLCGDQVYLDSPVLHYLARTHTPDELAGELLANYLSTWTQAYPLGGFRRVHQLGSMAFSPDDHDLWNNAPSIAPHVRDTWSTAGRAAWLKAARQLDRLFQAATPGVTAQVGALSIFVGDTRMARTEDRSRFMDPAQFEALRSWVQGLAGPGVLVTGQTLFAADTGFKGHVSDFTLPDYRQYRDLVSVLAATQHDLIVLTGDVHFGRVATATLASGRRIVELVASPMALVSALVGGKWKPTPPVFPAIPVPGVPQVPIVNGLYKETGNHAMTVGFSGIGQAVRLQATSWPIRPCQPAVGKPVHSTELH